MDEIRQHSVIIPIEEYEALKTIRADKEALKKEITEALLPYSGTHQHISTEEHSLKGLGIFGGYLFLLGVTIAMVCSSVSWGWYFLIGAGFILITSLATESY